MSIILLLKLPLCSLPKIKKKTITGRAVQIAPTQIKWQTTYGSSPVTNNSWNCCLKPTARKYFTVNQLCLSTFSYATFRLVCMHSTNRSNSQIDVCFINNAFNRLKTEFQQMFGNENAARGSLSGLMYCIIICHGSSFWHLSSVCH